MHPQAFRRHERPAMFHHDPQNPAAHGPHAEWGVHAPLRGGMPPFGGQLSEEEISNVAAYVVEDVVDIILNLKKVKFKAPDHEARSATISIATSAIIRQARIDGPGPQMRATKSGGRLSDEA